MAHQVNKTITNAVDIYAVGCVAYWLLTAKFVLDNKSNISNDVPIPPSRLTENVIPDKMESLIMSCLDKNPENRPQTAEHMAELFSYCSLDEPWTNELAKEWWLKQYGDDEVKNNSDIDSDAVTEIG